MFTTRSWPKWVYCCLLGMLKRELRFGRLGEMISLLLLKIYNSHFRASSWGWRHTGNLETLKAGSLRGCTWVECWKQIKSSRDFILAFTLGSLRSQRERLRKRGAWQGNNVWMCAESIKQVSLVFSAEFLSPAPLIPQMTSLCSSQKDAHG